jgi:hypothetical protein
VLVREGHAGQFEERVYLEAIAVVIGDAEQSRIGIERDHGPDGMIAEQRGGG